MNMRIIHVAHARRYPPRVTAFTEPFWQALDKGGFEVTRCSACARLSFPPKPICPHCWNDHVEWQAIGTLGRLYSWTRVHAGPAIFDKTVKTNTTQKSATPAQTTIPVPAAAPAATPAAAPAQK